MSTEVVREDAAPAITPRRRLATGGIGLLACALLALSAFVAALSIGPVVIAFPRVLEVLWHALARTDAAGPAREAIIVLDVRLPRAVLGFLVGSAIGSAGAIMQGIFRNPLADPALVGISNGAALAAVIWIVLGAGFAAHLPPLLADFGLPVAAFLGALAATGLLHVIATHRGRTSVATMLFAGIAVSALAGAGTGLMVFMASDQQLRDFTFWTFGSLGGASWAKALVAAPFVAFLLAASVPLARALDALALGEAEAFHVGVDVERTKRLAIAAVAAGAGAAVAVAGVVGFVGLVVPHLLRILIGSGHRVLLPASALLGGALLLLADVAARVLASPAELPLGVVTAALGAPFFIGLLLRRRAALFG